MTSKAIIFLFLLFQAIDGFHNNLPSLTTKITKFSAQHSVLVALPAQQDNDDDGVVEIGDMNDDDDKKKDTPAVIAPFLSQSNEIADDVLNPDLSDPKQTRVILYIILSLIPVVFLLPLILGSRDFLPADMPVQ
mmetsp:Transcript_3846/g.4440  ORF Transcript_3846/g.4440 Transcript_3846/m.4440 type:complete len:134 (+) Transcript_3846:111-512(+)|eukprot:CAMPEP_0194133956 /NCGR_PEP_ID=MMETSP0152-20130528/3997_1 /TAXON_ID=1049557 /ORGANISM="Thalassiothrix antarctica, Strain L6-D1" /LENGTH=133 /DNA_ID=CAMNT_0038829411 /DNA_START=137 /DNA_END=541 /DNA_ORIENTATION=-